MFLKLFKQLIRHKFIAGLIFLVILASGYFGYQKLTNNKSAVQYVTAEVQKGTITISVSGSGQVVVSNQVDVKTKVSGDVVYLGAKTGAEVKSGTVLAQIDSSEAQKSIRDAEANLESAKLSLEKLKKPADALSVLQAENSLAQAKESKQKAEDTLKKTYDDGFNTIANVFLDLPTIMTGLEDIFFDNTISAGSGSGDNITWYVNQTDYQTGARDKAVIYRDDVNNSYTKARTTYTKTLDNYKAISRNSETQSIEALISETYDTTKIIADTIKTSNIFIDFVQDDMEQHRRTIPTMVFAHQSSIDSYTSKTNSHLLSLLNVKTTIQTSKEAIVNAERTITEKTESLAKLKAGTDALDIQSAELTIKQRENALLDAKEKLADYYIYAPFTGIVATTDIKKGDSVSAGTVIVTLITHQLIAEITLNEVDIAKVKIGQRAILIFDAVSDLEFTGEVVELDAIGTISQGVVSYTVKVNFDSKDERVKPGMSVSANLITNVKTDILMVPNSSLKSRDDIYFVEVSSEGNEQAQVTVKSLSRKQVEIGIANDDFTEIISGLQEGDIVVTNTINSTNTNSANQNQQRNSLFRIPGMSGGGEFRR